MRKRNRRKLLSAFLSAALVLSTFTLGVGASADDDTSTETTLITNQSVTGDATYIGTYMKSEYYASKMGGFEITFQYTSVGTPASDNEIGFNDTFEFLVFDTSWGGWEKTTVGPEGYDQTDSLNSVSTGVEYTVTVPISVIEGKLSASNAVYGINLQTGGIGETAVTITSLKYVSAGFESEDTVLTGSWKKTSSETDTESEFGTLSLASGYATVYTNAWNVEVLDFSVSTFTNPVVAVTVEYSSTAVADGTIYPQAEILDSSSYEPVVANYPEVSEAGTVTYLTNIATTMTSMLLAFDSCTVTKVEIYDEAEENTTEITSLTNSTITDAMCAGWNLGNALDSTTDGATGETLWGNPTINKRLFKLVSEAGFKTVRIPVTWLSAVTVSGDTGTVDSDKCDALLDRVQAVVDMAIDYDLFVIINIQHDGSEDVSGAWLDIDAENQTGIRAAFETLWGKIATRFKDYDQHLIFESMNEVMEDDNYTTSSSGVAETTWTNINTLNQLFVDTVRDVGSSNTTRFLMVPAYNTNIDQTVSSSFEMPTYGKSKSTDYEMVSVHFYDPYNFTLNTGTGSTTEISDDDLTYIATQFAKLNTTFVEQGIPVVLGEFAAVDKDNLTAISTYLKEIVSQAHEYGISHVYWDNGYSGDYGMALWNRYTYAQTDMGDALISILTSCSEE